MGEKGELADEDVGIEEVEKTLKNEKPTGEDGVPIKFIKYLPKIWIREVT